VQRKVPVELAINKGSQKSEGKSANEANTKWNPSNKEMEKQQRHEFYVDVTDILSILEGCLNLIKECPLNMSDYHTKETDINKLIQEVDNISIRESEYS